MTTISVSEETWKRLVALKVLGETMDDVVSRVLDERESAKAEPSA